MHFTQGIILKREDFRERDERVVLYTRDFGKISVIAKGTKRVEAKLRGNLDIFNFVDILFVEGASFFILTGIDLKERFGELISDTYVYSSALCMVRIIDGIFGERLRDEKFFTFFYSAIKKLNGYGGKQQSTELYSWLLFKKFQMFVLRNQGYRFFCKDELSSSATRLLEMLNGIKHTNVRLTKHDFMSIENVFIKSFGEALNYRPYSWIPI